MEGERVRYKELKEEEKNNIEKKLENYESLLHLRKYKNKLLNILGSDNIMVIKNSIREILGK